MSKGAHNFKRRTEMDGRPYCRDCTEYPCQRKGRRSDGSPRYAPRCKRCWKKRYYPQQKSIIPDGVGRHHKGYRRHLKDTCEWCNFMALHPIQLDIDHIDNNHRNNHPSNLRTLCPPCHRLRNLAEMILAMLHRTYPASKSI